MARSGSGSSILFRSSRLRKRVGVVRKWSCLAQSKNGSFSFVDRSVDCTRSLHGRILLLFDALNGSAFSNRGGSIPPDCAGFDCLISKDERFKRAMIGSRAVRFRLGVDGAEREERSCFRESSVWFSVGLIPPCFDDAEREEICFRCELIDERKEIW